VGDVVTPEEALRTIEVLAARVDELDRPGPGALRPKLCQQISVAVGQPDPPE
jgi:hypothetical protein